ncbi:MAG: hypothetical protein CMJ50_07080 [Planctomycetaceae bacterium]|jgi:hypothetical protein|nr:hypothetical protein [Planctomycetaceae bacterium]
MDRLLLDRACSFHSDRAEAVRQRVFHWSAALSNRDLYRYSLTLAESVVRRHLKLDQVYLVVENRSSVAVRLFH